MSPEPLKFLISRAYMLRQARQFFQDRNILEVDCGALVKRAPIDSNIDVISADVSDTEQGFLHTSPEYAMKRLLSLGIGDIFFLGHVFRKGEIGRLHNPEFTMAEWYRINISFQEMINETCAFIFLFLGPLPVRVISYREAFTQYAGIDYTRDKLDHLLPSNAKDWQRTEALHYILSYKIEPHLGNRELTILNDYPPNEAALARLVEKNGELVAKRFEIYHRGVELANGYHELSDASVLKERFDRENKARELRNQETYILDEEFLSAIKNGLPDCCGVSVGFDRALMLRNKAERLSQVLPFAWVSS
jgi:lysyl-tRNA synthetase class 2